MADSEKLGLGIDNPCTIVFFSLRMNKCLKRVNDRHFWNPGVFSYAMIPRCHPNSLVFFFFFFFFIVTSYSRWVAVGPTPRPTWTIILLLDSAPNLGPLISRYEINKFENSWYRSVRISEVLKLLFQIVSPEDLCFHVGVKFQRGSGIYSKNLHIMFSGGNGRYFLTPRVISYAIIPRCRPKFAIFFCIVKCRICIVHGLTWDPVNR